jgi:cytochrome c oxidase subunit IV
MEHQHSFAPEVSMEVHHDSKETVKKIIKTTIVLSVITIIELCFGYGIVYLHKTPDYSEALVLAIKGVVVILSLLKAFYIVSIFMHLGDEIRNLIMTIVVPLLIFIWFIFAFLYDGNSYKNLKNSYDPQHLMMSKEKAPAEAEHEGEHGGGEHSGEKPAHEAEGAVH